MFAKTADAMSDDEWIREWQPVVRQAAGTIASRHRNQTARDVADEAEGIIYERRAAFVPQEGSKRTWCIAVLEYRFFDELRKQSSKRRLFTAIASSMDDNSTSCVEQLEVIETVPLNEHDMKTMESWNLKARIALLLLAGNWTTVRAEIWAKWLQEASVSKSFDPAEIDVSDRKTALKQLATILETTVGALERAIRRLRPQLQRHRLFRHYFEN